MANRVILQFVGDNRLGRTLTDVQDKLTSVTGATLKWGSILGGVAAVSAPAALAGVAVGFAGLGIAIAAQNEKVKASFTGLKDHVVSELKSMAQPFEPVLMRISDLGRKTFDAMGPQLRQAFATTAPYVETLASGLASLVKNVMPGFLSGMQAAKPVIDALSAGLAGTGTGLSQMFQAISTAGGPAASILSSLFSVINGLLPILGRLIADAATGLAPVLKMLAPIVLMLADAVGKVLGQAFIQLGPPLQKLLDKLTPIISHVLPALADLIIGVVIPALAGFINWLSSNIDSVEDFAQQSVIAFLSVTSGVLSFVSTTLGAMSRVFAVLGLLPGQFGASMRSAAVSTNSAKEGIDRFRGTVDAMHSKAVDINANTRGLREVQDLVRTIGLLPAARTITVNAVANVSSYIRGLIPGRAVGGTVNKGQTYLVGERGPEYLTMPGSGYVTPNHRMAQGSSGGPRGGTLIVKGSADSKVAELINYLVRTKQIQIA